MQMKKAIRITSAILLLMCLLGTLIPNEIRAEEVEFVDQQVVESVDQQVVVSEDIETPDGVQKPEPTEYYKSTFDDPWTYTVGTEAQGNLYPDSSWNWNQYKKSEPIYKHHYKFTVDDTARYDIVFDKGDSSWSDETTYVVSDRDKEPNDNYYNNYVRWDSEDVGTGDYPLDSFLDLEKGTTYHIIVENSSDSPNVLPYSFKITKRQAVTHRKDEADKPTSKIEFDKTYNKIFVSNFRHDKYRNRFDEEEGYRVYPDPNAFGFDYQYTYQYFKIVVPSAGRLTIDVNSENDIIGRMASSVDIMKAAWRWDLETLSGHSQKSVDVIPGTYYLGFGLVDQIAPYSFSVSFDPVVVAKDEKSGFDKDLNGTNTSWEAKESILTNQKYVAQSAYGDEHNSDWFAFELKNASPVYFSISSTKIKNIIVGVYVSTIYNEPRYTYPQWTAEMDNYEPIAGVQMQIPDEDEHGKYTALLPKGLYYIQIQKHADTGDYRFEVSTKVPNPVKSVDITDKNSGKSLNNISLQVNETRELEAKVLPVDAADVSVTWESDNESIAKINSSGVVTGVAEGSCKITVTSVGLDSKGQPVTDSITVTVKDKGENPDKPEPEPEPDPETKICPNVVTKQKVDLSIADYFGQSFEKKDKWTVSNTKIGSVSKGIFTAKKPGTVTVTWMDKDKNVKGIAKFDVEAPEIDYPINPKNSKKLTTFTYYRIDEEVDVTKLISTPTGLKPVKYECTDKKGKNFSFDPDTNILTVLKTGNCKINVYYNYGDNEKYAGKHTINIKSSLPKLKEKLKLTATKSTTVTISNVQEDLQVSWKAYVWNEETEDWDKTDKLIIGEVPGSNGRKCKITANGNKGDEIYLTAFVGEYEDEYDCIVTIK